MHIIAFWILAVFLALVVLAAHQSYRKHVRSPEKLCHEQLFHVREYPNGVRVHYLEGMPASWYDTPFIWLDLQRLGKRCKGHVVYYRNGRGIDSRELVQKCIEYRQRFHKEWDAHQGEVSSSFARNAPYDYEMIYYELATIKGADSELSVS